MASKDHPSVSSRNTGSATTKKMSREPKRKNRARAKRLIAADFFSTPDSGGFSLAFPRSPAPIMTTMSTAPSVTAMATKAVAKPSDARSTAPDEEPDTLQGVLGSRERRHQAEEPPFTSHELHCRF